MHNIHFIFKPLLGFLLTTVHLIILTEHFTALNVHVYKIAMNSIHIRLIKLFVVYRQILDCHGLKLAALG